MGERKVGERKTQSRCTPGTQPQKSLVVIQQRAIKSRDRQKARDVKNRGAQPFELRVAEQNRRQTQNQMAVQRPAAARTPSYKRKAIPIPLPQPCLTDPTAWLALSTKGSQMARILRRAARHCPAVLQRPAHRAPAQVLPRLAAGPQATALAQSRGPPPPPGFFRTSRRPQPARNAREARGAPDAKFIPPHPLHLQIHTQGPQPAAPASPCAALTPQTAPRRPPRRPPRLPPPHHGQPCAPAARGAAAPPWR